MAHITYLEKQWNNAAAFEWKIARKSNKISINMSRTYMVKSKAIVSGEGVFMNILKRKNYLEFFSHG